MIFDDIMQRKCNEMTMTFNLTGELQFLDK